MLPTNAALVQGEEWIPFDVAGSARSPGDIELFLWRHRRRFPHAMQALEAALPIALPAAAAAAAAPAGSVDANAGATSVSGASASAAASSGAASQLTVSREEVGRMIAAAVDEVKAQLQAEMAAQAKRAQCLVDKVNARISEREHQRSGNSVVVGRNPHHEVMNREC